MKINVLLLTAVSVFSFMSATQVFAAEHAAVKTATSHSRVSIAIEGFDSRSNDFTSIIQVTNQSNATIPVYTLSAPASLKAKSQWGWAAALRNTFKDGSDVSVSYRTLNAKMNDNTQNFDVVSQIISNSTHVTPYTASTGDIDSASAVIGISLEDAALGVKNATDTLTESAEVKYQQTNFDWGYAFKVSNDFTFRPYMGIGWRSIGYKDTVTHSSLGVFTSAALTRASADWLVPSGSSSTSIVDGADLALNGIDVNEVSTGAVINVTTTTAVLVNGATAADATDKYSVVTNSAYSSSDGGIPLDAQLPSYESKFSGFGPRVGFDSSYALGNSIAVTAGLSFTMPYAQLKTTGNTTVFTTRDLSIGGTTVLDGGTTAAGVNLQYYEAKKAFSKIEHRFIPEMEMTLGLRVANDITQKVHMTYFLEVGYRVIQDWDAIENVNAAETSTTQGAASSHFGASPAFVYSDLSNFGPYLKAGITFGT